MSTGRPTVTISAGGPERPRVTVIPPARPTVAARVPPRPQVAVVAGTVRGGAGLLAGEGPPTSPGTEGKDHYLDVLTGVVYRWETT